MAHTMQYSSCKNRHTQRLFESSLRAWLEERGWGTISSPPRCMMRPGYAPRSQPGQVAPSVASHRLVAAVGSHCPQPPRCPVGLGCDGCGDTPQGDGRMHKWLRCVPAHLLVLLAVVFGVVSLPAVTHALKQAPAGVVCRTGGIMQLISRSHQLGGGAGKGSLSCSPPRPKAPSCCPAPSKTRTRAIGSGAHSQQQEQHAVFCLVRLQLGPRCQAQQLEANEARRREAAVQELNLSKVGGAPRQAVPPHQPAMQCSNL